MCTVNRQLSESRTRVELVTSFWQEAAIYVNNNFVVRDFLHSDAAFEVSVSGLSWSQDTAAIDVRASIRFVRVFLLLIALKIFKLAS